VLILVTGMFRVVWSTGLKFRESAAAGEVLIPSVANPVKQS
jgi:hypothetical protein